MSIKNLINVILAVVLSFIYTAPCFAIENEEEYNFTNLIVFAKFDGEDEFINTKYGNGTAVRKIIDNSYNAAEYNVSDYLKSISGDRVKMKSVFLFDDGGSVTLSRKREYYAVQSDENPNGYADSGEKAQRMYQLREDWSDKVNKAVKKGNSITDFSGKEKIDYSELDKNNDGKIDLISIIYKPTEQTNISVEWASPLWNYQDYSNLVSIEKDGVSLTSNAFVQVTNNYKFLYTDAKGNTIIALGVTSHETIHSFGLLDLYKSSSQPVGYMSAMGKHTSEVAQFITIKEREILGWIKKKNIRTILSEGDYSLEVTTDTMTDGVLGYKMGIPQIGKTLYIEYRRFDGKGSKYDSQKKELFLADGSKIKGLSFKSGLVCYLLTTGTKYPNNMYSNSNNWNYSAIGGQYNNKPDAALELYDFLDITDDLYIEVTEMTDKKITFNIAGDFFNNTNLPTVNGVEITDCPLTVSKGENYKLSAKVNGENNPPQSIDWSIDGNTDKNTAIDENGMLKIGEKENGKTIKVFAKFQDKFSDCREITVKSDKHNLEYHAAVLPTCESDGSFEYFKCLDCGKILLDMSENADGSIYEETTEENMKVPALGHTAGNLIIDKDPTPKKNGEAHRECIRCHTVMERTEIKYYPDPEDINSETIVVKIKAIIRKIIDAIIKIFIK